MGVGFHEILVSFFLWITISISAITVSGAIHLIVDVEFYLPSLIINGFVALRNT